MSFLPMESAREESDIIRTGPAAFHPQVQSVPPVQACVLQNTKAAKEADRKLAVMVYGPGFALRNKMEEQILSQFRRMPGLESHHVGLDTLLGLDETIDVEDYLGDAMFGSPHMPTHTVHEIMQAKLGL